MLSYCLKCRKNTKSKNSKFAKTKNGRIMLLSKCTVCSSKKLKFIKEQEGKELLSKLRGNKVPILGDWPIANILF